MLARYVFADLVRNPRRTLSTAVGVALGVGLFCGVLFFVDGLSASMTQRAVAPLAIDAQRIVTERVGGEITLTQTFATPGPLHPDAQSHVDLELRNPGKTPANEVTVRSRPDSGLRFVAGSAQIDGVAVVGIADNPFAHGLGQIGLNLGTVAPGTTRHLTYRVEAQRTRKLDATAVTSSISSRESVTPVPANRPLVTRLDELARLVAREPGVASAYQLSFADLGTDKISAGKLVAPGPAKILGFDETYAGRDSTIVITKGRLTPTGAVLSAEAARALHADIGSRVMVTLPDASTTELAVTGIADLSRARSLFSSRRGGDLETFVYTRNSVVVSPARFEDTVLPAYERAATTRGERLKTPPVREIDIRLQRSRLAADPATAAEEARQIGRAITAVAAHQDYLLNNISNTLDVAAGDAQVAKRLFVFLGVPGGLLAAMLAAYAGTVLAETQRREQATLRIRGASRRHLLRMLALRTTVLTAVGAVFGLAIGYLVAGAILGSGTLQRASTRSLATSALLGSLGGFVATGLALYVTGRRSIDREINEDRAAITRRAPLWRRARLDLVGMAVVIVGTTLALRARAFDGAAGSVYFGRSVKLNLVLLLLPVAVWIAGSLLGARVLGNALTRTQPRSSSSAGRALPRLYRLSIGRRPWSIANGAVIVALIVALATCLAAFTASYDTAKMRDARYATGADIRIAPSPTSQRTYQVNDANRFRTAGISAVSPVIYGLSNVILQSARTSDPANLAAIDPETFASVAPIADVRFSSGTATSALAQLHKDPTAVYLSHDMASFLKSKPGDKLSVLLVRSTNQQVEVSLHIVGLFQRLPGFPDGADALMSITEHTAKVPTKAPDFFLATTRSNDSAGLIRAVDELHRGPATDHLQIDTRTTTLARDQSSLASLNIAGLVSLDSTFSLAMVVVTIAIFVFGLLLARRREYVTLRAQGLEPGSVRTLIIAEAGTVAIAGSIAGIAVGTAMGFYFVTVLRPLFVLNPDYSIPTAALMTPVLLVLAATFAAAIAGSRLVNRLDPTELLRDE
jgi:putative ABC transport system permease protein